MSAWARLRAASPRSVLVSSPPWTAQCPRPSWDLENLPSCLSPSSPQARARAGLANHDTKCSQPGQRLQGHHLGRLMLFVDGPLATPSREGRQEALGSLARPSVPFTTSPGPQHHYTGVRLYRMSLGMRATRPQPSPLHPTPYRPQKQQRPDQQAPRGRGHYLPRPGMQHGR